MLITPFALVQPIEDLAAEAIERGDLPAALLTLIKGVESLVARDDLAGRSLFLPLLDQCLVEMAERIAAQQCPAGIDAADGCQLVVATETYGTGGHSRVLEDICRHLPRPVIVLTDLFGRINAGQLAIDYLHRDAGAAAVLTLPPGPPLVKAVNLLRTAMQLRPQRIVYLTHHQDAIAFAALASRRVRVPSLYIHHADHNPALGATIDHIHHVDLIRQTGATCAAELQRDTGYLPLHARDQGARAQPARSLAEASVVTSGAPQKYLRDGALAYRSIVATACRVVGGPYHHIGPMPADWVAEIREHLASQGIAPERFHHVGAVPSLWAALRQLDADVYLSSAPLGGGRAAVEAQGCGYPVVAFDPSRGDRPLLATDFYHPGAPCWSHLERLDSALRAALAEAPAQASQSRRFYEQHFGEAAFGASLQRLFQTSQTLLA